MDCIAMLKRFVMRTGRGQSDAELLFLELRAIVMCYILIPQKN